MYSKYVSIYVYINFVYIHSVQVVSEICRKSIKISGSSYKNLILSERKLLQFPTQNRHLVVSIQHTYTHTRIHLYQHVHKGAARPSSTHTHSTWPHINICRGNRWFNAHLRLNAIGLDNGRKRRKLRKRKITPFLLYKHLEMDMCVFVNMCFLSIMLGCVSISIDGLLLLCHPFLWRLFDFFSNKVLVIIFVFFPFFLCFSFIASDGVAFS